jgi:hypothetical protein
MTRDHMDATVAVVSHTGSVILLPASTQATESCGFSARLHPAAATQHRSCAQSLALLSCRELIYKDEGEQAQSETKAAGAADAQSKASSGTQAAAAAAGQVSQAAEALCSTVLPKPCLNQTALHLSDCSTWAAVIPGICCACRLCVAPTPHPHHTHPTATADTWHVLCFCSHCRWHTAAGTLHLQWTPGDVEAATRQLFKSITAFHPTEGVHERRAALLMLLKMWGAGHPLPQCRSGAAGLVKALPQVWPEDAEKDPWGDDSSMTKDAGKAPTDICSSSAAAVAAESSAGQGVAYDACKGSKPDTRGFTCGLWLLFHTTAAR